MQSSMLSNRILVASLNRLKDVKLKFRIFLKKLYVKKCYCLCSFQMGNFNLISISKEYKGLVEVAQPNPLL